MHTGVQISLHIAKKLNKMQKYELLNNGVNKNLDELDYSSLLGSSVLSDILPELQHGVGIKGTCVSVRYILH